MNDEVLFSSPAVLRVCAREMVHRTLPLNSYWLLSCSCNLFFCADVALLAFQTLSDDARRLYARLYYRKRADRWFQCASLHYQEVADMQVWQRAAL